MSLKIHVKDRDMFLQRGVEIPGSIWRHAPFKFVPSTFAVGNDYLKHKILDSGIQTGSLEGFMEEPTLPMLYAVGSEPTPERALYFAAFLTQHYLTHTRNTLARWYPLRERNDLVRNHAPCSFLVITECYSNMTAYRLEKLRDLISHYDDIPKVMVVSGTDPVTFCLSELHIKNTHLFYSAAGINRKIEVV